MPATATAGTAFNFTVTAYDRYGNVATGYTGTIHFTSSDASAMLPANYTFTSANAGTHTFSATLKTGGTQTITATDTVTSSITGKGSTTVSTGSTTATASFLEQDATTQGSWIGTYGAQGYDIVSGPSSLPAGDTVTPSGQSTYTWTTTSSDPRALQVPGSSNRVAAVWYSATSFTVDVNLGRRPGARPGAVLPRLGQQGPRASRCRSATPPRGPCWTPRRSRRSRAACTWTGRSRATW